MGKRVRACVCAVGIVAALARTEAADAQPSDEHAAASALVATLAQDKAHAAVLADVLAKAKDALERATRMRTAGDEAHAKAADGLAYEWAETGRDLVKAADSEAAASELRRKAIETQAQLDRQRALVEEGVASVGRLRAELDQAHANPTARPAVEVHEGDPKPPKVRKDKPAKAGGAP